MTDFLDPRTWADRPAVEFRIYGDDNAQTWGVVDEVDYHFLIRWKWSWTTPKPGMRAKPKLYLRRVFEEQVEPESFTAGGLWENPETGRTVRARKPRVQKTLRMHTVIMLRTGITPPSPDFVLVDHFNGDEFDYRRINLRWVNHSMNNFNKNGRHYHEEALEREAGSMHLREEVPVISGRGDPPP